MWSTYIPRFKRAENVKPSSSKPTSTATPSKSGGGSSLSQPTVPDSLSDYILDVRSLTRPRSQTYAALTRTPSPFPAAPPNSPTAPAALLWEAPPPGTSYVTKPPADTPFNEYAALASRPKLPLRKPHSTHLSPTTMGTTKRPFNEPHLNPKIEEDKEEEVEELWEMGPHGLAVRIKNGYKGPGHFGEGPTGLDKERFPNRKA